jgi:hypothetical protein
MYIHNKYKALKDKKSLDIFKKIRQKLNYS